MVFVDIKKSNNDWFVQQYPVSVILDIHREIRKELNYGIWLIIQSNALRLYQGASVVIRQHRMNSNEQMEYAR